MPARARMGNLAIAQRLAALLLLVCMVLPLSKCTAKVQPGSGKPAVDTVYYGYEMIAGAVSDLPRAGVDDILFLLALLTVFLLPVCTLALRERWQPPVLLAGSLPASHFLYYWVIVIPSAALIGGLLAIFCWVVLVLVSIAQLWLARVAAVRHKAAAQRSRAIE